MKTLYPCTESKLYVQKIFVKHFDLYFNTNYCKLLTMCSCQSLVQTVHFLVLYPHTTLQYDVVESSLQWRLCSPAHIYDVQSTHAEHIFFFFTFPVWCRWLKMVEFQAHSMTVVRGFPSICSIITSLSTLDVSPIMSSSSNVVVLNVYFDHLFPINQVVLQW